MTNKQKFSILWLSIVFIFICTLILLVSTPEILFILFIFWITIFIAIFILYITVYCIDTVLDMLIEKVKRRNNDR